MELVIFVGLQASGKTSFYQARFARETTDARNIAMGIPEKSARTPRGAQ